MEPAYQNQAGNTTAGHVTSARASDQGCPVEILRTLELEALWTLDNTDCRLRAACMQHMHS